MNTKHFIPIELKGKIVLVENAPEEKDFEDDGRDFYIMRYEAAIEACPKLPTIPSDFAYWKSKEGVKMVEGEFQLLTTTNYKNEIVNTYARPIPKSTTTTKTDSTTQ